MLQVQLVVSHNKAHQARPQAGWTSVPALVLRLSLRYRKTITSTAAPVGGVMSYQLGITEVSFKA